MAAVAPLLDYFLPRQAAWAPKPTDFLQQFANAAQISALHLVEIWLLVLTLLLPSHPPPPS
jgi:hypothetical protein